MIKTDIIKIPFTSDDIEIEAYFHKLDIEPLRWAIVKVENRFLDISVSYYSKN